MWGKEVVVVTMEGTHFGLAGLFGISLALAGGDLGGDNHPWVNTRT